MTLEHSLKTLIAFANRFLDQANNEEQSALKKCAEFAATLAAQDANLIELKKRIDEHTLYLRSGWATEKPVAPDNTYDLLRAISKAIGTSKLGKSEPE